MQIHNILKSDDDDIVKLTDLNWYASKGASPATVSFFIPRGHGRR